MQRAKQISESIELGIILALAGGFMDVYSYVGRDHVFANAQTGNIVLCSAYLFDGQWRHSARYLIPVLSFLLGIFAAECIHRHFKYTEKVHWRQMIVLAEIVLLFAVGFLPQTAIPSMAAPVVTITAVHSTGLASSPVFGEAGSSFADSSGACSGAISFGRR